MFELKADEMVIDSTGPLQEDRHLKTCSECPQVAFRVLHLKSETNVRDVGLCGAQFPCATRSRSQQAAENGKRCRALPARCSPPPARTSLSSRRSRILRTRRSHG